MPILTPQEFKRRIEQGDIQLVDVRAAVEFNAGHIKRAINMDVGDSFSKQITKLDNTLPVYVYCAVGVRSANAAETMEQQGFTVYDLKGGITRWINEDLPITK